VTYISLSDGHLLTVSLVYAFRMPNILQFSDGKQKKHDTASFWPTNANR